MPSVISRCPLDSRPLLIFTLVPETLCISAQRQACRTSGADRINRRRWRQRTILSLTAYVDTCPLIAARACTAPCTALAAGYGNSSSSVWLNAGTFPRRWSKPPTLSARARCFLLPRLGTSNRVLQNSRSTQAICRPPRCRVAGSELRANVIPPGEQSREFSHVGRDDHAHFRSSISMPFQDVSSFRMEMRELLRRMAVYPIFSSWETQRKFVGVT